MPGDRYPFSRPERRESPFHGVAAVFVSTGSALELVEEQAAVTERLSKLFLLSSVISIAHHIISSIASKDRMQESPGSPATPPKNHGIPPWALVQPHSALGKRATRTLYSFAVYLQADSPVRPVHRGQVIIRLPTPDTAAIHLTKEPSAKHRRPARPGGCALGRGRRHTSRPTGFRSTPRQTWILRRSRCGSRIWSGIQSVQVPAIASYWSRQFNYGSIS